MVWQDHQYHTIGDNWANRSTFPNRQSTTLTFWPHVPIIQGHTCFTSITSIHWCIYRHTSCQWLEAFTGPSTENLASTGGRRHQCLSVCNTVDRSLWRSLRPSAGQAQQWVSEWVCSLLLHPLSCHSLPSLSDPVPSFPHSFSFSSKTLSVPSTPLPFPNSFSPFLHSFPLSLSYLLPVPLPQFYSFCFAAFCVVCF